jgi:hypothetical protein
MWTQPVAKQAKAAEVPKDPRLAARARLQAAATAVATAPAPQFQFRNSNASASAFKQSFVPLRQQEASAPGIQGRPSAGPVFQNKVDNARMKLDPIGALFGDGK